MNPAYRLRKAWSRAVLIPIDTRSTTADSQAYPDVDVPILANKVLIGVFLKTQMATLGDGTGVTPVSSADCWSMSHATVRIYTVNNPAKKSEWVSNANMRATHLYSTGSALVAGATSSAGANATETLTAGCFLPFVSRSPAKFSCKTGVNSGGYSAHVTSFTFSYVLYGVYVDPADAPSDTWFNDNASASVTTLNAQSYCQYIPGVPIAGMIMTGDSSSYLTQIAYNGSRGAFTEDAQTVKSKLQIQLGASTRQAGTYYFDLPGDKPEGTSIVFSFSTSTNANLIVVQVDGEGQPTF